MFSRLAPLLVLMALCAMFAVGIWRQSPDGSLPRAAEPPHPAYALDLPALEGSGKVDLANWRGKWVLVNFFASWCVPCAVESKDLADAADKAGKGRLALIGVDWKDKRKDASSWLKREGNPYAAVGFDAPGQSGVVWGITGVPENFLIDPAGVIVWHLAGPLTGEDIAKEILPRIIDNAAG